MSIESVMPFHHLFSCCPRLFPPSICPSLRVFSNDLVLCIRWHQVLELQHQSFNEYSGLISFRIDWLDLLSVQGTLKSLLQHHNSKASILRHSSLFYGPTLTAILTNRKTIALARWTFATKVMSLLLNTLSLSRIFSVSVVSPFLKCHVIGSSFQSFQISFFSVNKLHSIFLHAFSWFNSSFLFSDENILLFGCALSFTLKHTYL